MDDQSGRQADRQRDEEIDIDRKEREEENNKVKNISP
jgi:hypothetical protein